MPASNDPNIRMVKASDLRKSPLQRESLTQQQEEAARAIFEYLTPYLDTTFEQFEINFLRDANPDAEIQVWYQIAVIHSSILEHNPDATDDDGKDVFSSLLIISMGGTSKPENVSERVWDLVNQFVSEHANESDDE